MITRPATVIARVDPPGELSHVRALIDECDCGAQGCEASVVLRRVVLFADRSCAPLHDDDWAR